MMTAGLPELVARAYEAACAPDGWPDFVRDTTDYFGARGGVFLIWRHAPNEHLVPMTHGIDPAEVDDWFGLRNYPGSLFHRLSQTGAGEIFEQAGGDQQGWPDGQTLAGIVECHHDSICAVVLTGDTRHTTFSPADHDALGTLVGFLHRTRRIHQQFIGLMTENRIAHQIMDSAPRGIAILGRGGQLLCVNAEARRILSHEDALSDCDGRLQVADPVASEQIEHFLNATDRPGQDEAEATDGNDRTQQPELPRSLGLRINRNGSATPYQLVLYRLTAQVSQVVLEPHDGIAVAVIHDPAAAALPTDDLLAVFFDLTPAEAHLAQALCQGLSVPEVAEQLSVSVHTTRTHLRNIFHKVGVHSQHALVQRISQSLHIVGLSH